jgi:hypothetical protein
VLGDDGEAVSSEGFCIKFTESAKILPEKEKIHATNATYMTFFIIFIWFLFLINS